MLIINTNSKNVLIDTLYSSGLLNIEFVDLNKDNNSDILVSYIGNNPTNDLYLFDPTNNIFRNLEGFIKYPDAVQLKAYPKFYYSYHRAGCADLDWVSDLFKIENFKTIQIGRIYGMSCEDNPQVIEIYKKLFPLSPSYRPNLTLVRMRAGCGVHKHTPRPHNQHHFDFYKCDAFKIENIIFLDSKAIA